MRWFLTAKQWQRRRKGIERAHRTKIFKDKIVVKKRKTFRCVGRWIVDDVEGTQSLFLSLCLSPLIDESTAEGMDERTNESFVRACVCAGVHAFEMSHRWPKPWPQLLLAASLTVSLIIENNWFSHYRIAIAQSVAFAFSLFPTWRKWIDFFLVLLLK